MSNPHDTETCCCVDCCAEREAHTTDPKPTKKERKIAVSHLWGWPPKGAQEWIETGDAPNGEFTRELAEVGALANLLAWYREHLKKETTNE